MRAGVGRRRIAGALLLLIPAAVTIFLGWRLKFACAEHAWDGYQYTHSCYNDIYALWFFRDLQPDPTTGKQPARFPYLDSTAASRANQRDIEYPVGTGLYVGIVAKTVRTASSYFNASAVGLAVAGLAAVFATALTARESSRVLYFALAPTLLLYAFHNWDLLPVAATALALLAFHRRRDGLAGIALGLGASAKLYPLFLVPILLIARWRETHPRGSSMTGSGRIRGGLAAVGDMVRQSPRMIGGFAGVVLLMNVPVYLANSGGWWYPWQFQSERFTNYETFWYMIYRHAASLASPQFWFGPGPYPRIMNVVSAAVFLAGSALLVRFELRRERFRPYAVCFGVLLIWLLSAKVYSPQYMLWLLPFFVLLRIPWFGYAAFALTDVAVWAAISALFLALQYQTGAAELRTNLLEAAVYARYLALVWLIWLSRRAPELVGGEPAEEAGPIRATAAVASDS